MSKRYDTTLKVLADVDPVGFLTGLGEPAPPGTQVLNPNLTVLNTGTDIAFGIGWPIREVLHIEGQASSDAGKEDDIFGYHALLRRQYHVPVHSVLLLLRPQARRSDQTGRLEYNTHTGRGKMRFEYEVIAIWERSAEAMLAGPLATLPLATLCQLPEGMDDEAGVAEVMRRIRERLDREAAPRLARQLYTASFVLTGLRLPRARVQAIFEGVPAVRESDTYQAILDEGRAEGRAEGRDEGLAEGRDEGRLEEAREVVLLQGCLKFGDPDDGVARVLGRVRSLDRLRRMIKRLLFVGSWQELLQIR